MDEKQYLNYVIKQKLNHLPHIASADHIKMIKTDMDHFPYSRFFRGRYTETRPVIFNREAGYCLRNNESCYIPKFCNPNNKLGYNIGGYGIQTSEYIPINLAP